MRDNPYDAGNSETLPTQCFIADAAKLQMPQRCIVCDSPDAELHSYVQDHVPMILPWVAVFQRTPAVLPYCAQHAAAFQRRFSILRYVQWTLIAIFAGGVVAAAVAEDRGGIPDDVSTIMVVLSMSALFLLPVTVIVRRFLYDAYFKHRGDGLRVSSHYVVFIERLRAANGLLSPTRDPLPFDMVSSLPASHPLAQERFIETRAGSDQLTSRGSLLPAVVVFFLTFLGLWTAYTLVNPSMHEAAALAIILVLNGFAGLLIWWVLRVARRRHLAGWSLGHWIAFVTVAYALGVGLALFAEWGPQPGR